ncbi:MAG TPA: hypothetical protein VMD99_09985 [Terriglobales bacterium]|nr:hypothetical protein [Terriglobales bacterium]
MRTLLLISVLLLGVCWAAAESMPAAKASGKTEASTGSQTTVLGCLSSSDGKYMLTDSQGKMYDLTGDTSILAEHIGHEVKITGTESTSENTPSNSGATSNHSNAETLEVSSVKHISKTCKNGAMSH